MDCPVCKYPNQPGATHCGMCYEVFNRSAAQAYMHAVKRERRQTEEDEPSPKAAIQSEKILEKADSLFKKIDWVALRATALSLWKRHKPVALIAAGLIGAWILITFL